MSAPLLRPEDEDYIAFLLGPDFLLPRARAHGVRAAVDHWSDHERLLDDLTADSRWVAVLGARQASLEARAAIRRYAGFLRWRDNKTARDLRLARQLRTAGYVGGFQPVLPTASTPWRRTAAAFWDRPAPMLGVHRVRLSHGNLGRRLEAQIAHAVSSMLVALPELNRAWLQGRLWQRTTGHVMIHLEPAREQVRSVLVNAHRWRHPQLQRHLRRVTRDMIAAERHELSSFVDRILRAWAPHGFIASPAGAMLSLVGSKGGIVEGHAPLLTDINGVPISIVAGCEEDGWLTLGAQIDHRVMDAHQMSLMWKFLKNVNW